MDGNASRRYRLRKRKDIERVFAQGRRVGDRILTVFAVWTGLDRSRCGVGVSKRHGGAVRRNRIRRLCREAFRLSRDQLPVGWDYMIIPRVGDEPALAVLRSSVVAMAARLAEADDAGRPRT